jgi:large subunit ribosomal protein L22
LHQPANSKDTQVKRSLKHKEIKMEAVAKLRNYPTSPRKMRLLADLIRGHKVERALAILEHNPKHPAVPLRKVVLSAINNWKQKNESGDEGELVVKTVFVDGARTLKRMRPAPQGRGYRVRKRSNHVTLVVDVKNKFNADALVEEVKEEEAALEAKETMAKAAKPKKAAKSARPAGGKSAAPKKAATKKATKKK